MPHDHTTLNITKEEYDALLIVLDAMKSGRIQHTSYDPDTIIFFDEGGSIRIRTLALPFNMATSGAKTECGTMACIGGWMWAAMRNPALDEPTLKLEEMRQYVWVHRSPALEELFFQDANETRLQDITVEDAIKLIEEFLNPHT